MNASIRGIIDHMFRDTVDNAETRALHEELLNNCLEHYEDLIGRGMSETEAIDAVVDSLKGMKEVIDEYPKKPGSGNKNNAESGKTDTVPEIRVEQETERKEVKTEKPSEYCYSPETIRKIRTDLKSSDLKISRSSDGKIHVRCEDMEQLICEQNGDSLRIRTEDKSRQSIQEAGEKMKNSEFSLNGLLSFIGKAISSVASNITVSWNVYIELPDMMLEEMDLNSKSGDVEMEACVPKALTIHTMSGDAIVKAMNGSKAERVIITSMSGDTGFSGDACKVTMSSMSGDVEAKGSFTEAELKSTSGEAGLAGAAEKVRVHSVSGDVNIRIHSASVRNIEGRSTSGDVEIRLPEGTNSVHARTSTVSGEIKCSVPDAGANAILTIDAGSVSGDVTIS